MFMPAGAYDPTPPFTLDSSQLLRIFLMDPFTRFALVLIILIILISVGAILVVKLITKRNATVREEQGHG
jgi:flagellar biogenesis protein FliO